MADENDPPEPTPTAKDAAPAADAAPLGDAMKNAFAEYLAANDIRPEEGKDLQVDLDFLKNHAGPLIVHMLRNATQSLLPKELKLSVKAPESAAPDSAATEAPASDGGEAPKPAAPIGVTFDLGDFLARLLNPPRP